MTDYSTMTDEQIEKEYQESNLIPKGTICDFEVLPEITYGTKTIKTEDKNSSSGNPMTVLVQKVYYGEDQFKIIINYHTFATLFTERQARHAAKTLGLPREKFSAENCIGKSGKCIVGIEKDKTGEYPNKNKIIEYLDKTVQVATKEEELDGIPFEFKKK